MKHSTLMGLFAMVCAIQLAVPAYMIAKYERTLTVGRLYKFKTAPVYPYDALRGRYVALGLNQASIPVANGSATVFKRGRKVFAKITTDKDGFADLSEVSVIPPASGDYITGAVQYFNNYPQWTQDQIRQPGALALKLLEAQDPVSVYLRSKLNDYEKKQLEEKKAGLPQTCPPEIIQTLAQFLNRIITDYENGMLLADRVAGKTSGKDSRRGYDWNLHRRLNAEFLVKNYPGEVDPLPPAQVQLKLPIDRYYINEKLAPQAEQAYREHNRRTRQDAYVGVRVLKGTAVVEDLYLGDKPIHEYLKAPLPQK